LWTNSTYNGEALTDEQVKVLYEGNDPIVRPAGVLATQWARIRSGFVAPVVRD